MKQKQGPKNNLNVLVTCTQITKPKGEERDR